MKVSWTLFRPARNGIAQLMGDFVDESAFMLAKLW